MNDCTINYIKHENTFLFSDLIINYIKSNPTLRHLYKYETSIEEVEQIIINRKNTITNRKVLVNRLLEQYKNINNKVTTEANINSLLLENTFTVCAAHQPNIMGGPIFTIYKIAHAIQLTKILKVKYPEYNFVPVYYIGSEDADLDELNHLYLGTQKFEWNTLQTGAVGKMKVDDAFIQVINQIKGFIGVLPNASKVIENIENQYLPNIIIAEANRNMMHSIFGNEGLVILNPDDDELKRLFLPIVKKELETSFSKKMVAETVASIPANYKVQTAGRDINLFYLNETKRIRIEKSGDKFIIDSVGEFTLETLMQLFINKPSLISPNVILRPVFQESILPNLIFVCGGGEVAYWIELKKVFEAANVPYPMIMLRQSIMIIDKKMSTFLTQYQLNWQDIFTSKEKIFDQYVIENTDERLSNIEIHSQILALYELLEKDFVKIDPTLEKHIKALKSKALNKLQDADKKLLKAAKQKHFIYKNQLDKQWNNIFPGGTLQERQYNYWWLYLQFGELLLPKIYKTIQPFNNDFAVIVEH